MEANKTPKVSIIVPVYNVEKYLRRAVDSIVRQTYDNLEIILVDDGSTDASGSICDEYALRDNRIKVIHKDNGGLSEARNQALDVATGDLISFVDSDDCVAPNFIDTLIRLKEENNAQIAMCRFKRFTDEIPASSEDVSSCQIWKKDDILKRYYGEYGPICCVVWNKLYDANLFEGLRFPKGLKNEDEFLSPKLLDGATTLVYTESELYFYFVNNNSITTDDKYLLSEDIYKVFDDRIKYFSKSGGEYDDFIKLTKKEYLDRIVIRYRKTHSRALLARYRKKYKEFKGVVPGVGYRIFNVSPGLYMNLLKIMHK